MSPRQPASSLGGLHVLTDDDPRWTQGPVEQARAACSGGADVVQLRVKHASDRQSLEWAREIRRITASAGVAFVMNDRFDLALLAEADGVHLGQGDLPPGRLPPDARSRLRVGRSTHTPAQLVETQSESVDYVAFGPVFGTESKESEYEKRGIRALHEAASLAKPRPLIAIGGIGCAEIAEVVAAGAAGIAVISAVAGARDGVAATRKLSKALRAAFEGEER